MKPVYIKKNGTVHKVAGLGMPSAFPAENVAYDNTTSGLQADDIQSAIDELSQGGGGGTAATTSYDNTISGLQADDVQEAIDEVVSTLDNKLNHVNLTSTIETTSTSTRAYSRYDKFYREDTGEYCSASTNIAIGDTLVKDTNYTVITIDEYLQQLADYKVDKVSGKGLSTNDYSDADKTKVDALGTASTLNVAVSGNAGTSEVVKGNDTRLTDSRNAADVYSWAKESTKPSYTASEVGAIATTAKGTANGVAELDANGKVPSSQLPEFVDDVIEAYYDTTTDRFYEESTFEHVITPTSGKSWVDIPANKSYRWTGSVYVRVDEGVQIGETSSTAYRGDRGKTAYDHSQITSGNPHNVSKSDVGLGNVNNTSDKNKPLSDATKEALLMKIGVEAITHYYEPSMVVEMGRYAEGSNIYVESEGRMYRATTDIDIGDTLVVDTNCVPVDIQYMIMEKLGVDNLTSVVESVDRASNAHSMYSRFYLGYLNKWAKATANIAINDMLVMGTNYEIVTIEDVFSGIESGMSQMSTAISNKVDKVSGKGLSTNDYTTAEKTKLSGISANANKTESSTTNGNIKIDGTETPVYRNYANNTVLSTDKTPYLNRQCLTPTGFSSYVREKLIGASVAWNQLVQNGDFADSTGWSFYRGTTAISGNVVTLTATDAVPYALHDVNIISGHKYLVCGDVKQDESGNMSVYPLLADHTGTLVTVTTVGSWVHFAGIWQANSTKTSYFVFDFSSKASGNKIYMRNAYIIDLTLAFGSTVADTLYAMTNNGGIDWLRNHNYPIDQYTQYGYGLYSSKPSAKKIYDSSNNLLATYDLGNTELRGHLIVQNGEIVAEGDVRESNGEVTRKYGIVDLGTLEWTYNSSNHRFYVTLPLAKASNSISSICAKYANASDLDVDKTYTMRTSYQVANVLSILISDSAYTDATTFKTAMSGVYLAYELATPTTETSSPFADPMSLNGCTTEEYVDDRTIPVPVGHETQYMGQSEDVVEIPSGSLSDGKRKLVSETSGGKTQYYWEDYVDDKPKQAVIESLLTYTSVSNKYTFPVDGYVHLQILNGATAGDYITIGLYDSQDVYVTSAKLISASGSVDHMSIFVKRGMKVFISGMTEGQDKIRAAFRGIT